MEKTDFKYKRNQQINITNRKLNNNFLDNQNISKSTKIIQMDANDLFLYYFNNIQRKSNKYLEKE